MGLTSKDEYEDGEEYALAERFDLLHRAVNELAERIKGARSIPEPYSLLCLNLGISNQQSARLLGSLLKLIEHRDDLPGMSSLRAVLEAVIPKRAEALSDQVVLQLASSVRFHYTSHD